jgi:hypothetical protein
MPFHPSYSLVLGSGYFRLGLRRFHATGAPLVLLFHLTDFAAPLGHEWLRGWRSRLFTLSHLDQERKRRACERMLAEVAQRYRLGDTEAVLAWRSEETVSGARAGSL